MKKLNKKGFTIVELVIVIAVIAILAAVLIPTFSGVVEKANVSAAEQEARNNMTNDLVAAEADYSNMTSIIVGDAQYYEDTNGTKYYTAAVTGDNVTGKYVLDDTNGTVTVGEHKYKATTDTKAQKNTTYYTYTEAKAVKTAVANEASVASLYISCESSDEDASKVQVGSSYYKKATGTASQEYTADDSIYFTYTEASIAEFNIQNVDTAATIGDSGSVKVSAYNGVYDASANTWTDTVKGYNCTYSITTGEWTIEK